MDCTYFALKTAFGKVPQERLLWKLENIGGRGRAFQDVDGELNERKRSENSGER